MGRSWLGYRSCPLFGTDSETPGTSPHLLVRMRRAAHTCWPRQWGYFDNGLSAWHCAMGENRKGEAMSEAQKLVACPLCGADEGYRLDEGSTYRWWSVHCAGCGQEVSEARATYPAETASRTSAADEAWNAAGAYAQSLRDRIAALEAQQAQAPGWQPIETAPKDGSRILLWWDGLVREGWCGGAGASRDGGDWWRSHSLTVCNGRPTHWVPLPPAPQQGAKP